MKVLNEPIRVERIQSIIISFIWYIYIYISVARSRETNNRPGLWKQAQNKRLWAPLGSGKRKINKLCARFYNPWGRILNCGYRLSIYIHVDRLVNCVQFYSLFIFLPPELQDNDHKRELNHLLTLFNIRKLMGYQI